MTGRGGGMRHHFRRDDDELLVFRRRDHLLEQVVVVADCDRRRGYRQRRLYCSCYYLVDCLPFSNTYGTLYTDTDIFLFDEINPESARKGRFRVQLCYNK